MLLLALLQDAVTRQAKFMIYKRGGHRTIINHQGDMLVRPTFIELSVHNRPGASSVSQVLNRAFMLPVSVTTHQACDIQRPLL